MEQLVAELGLQLQTAALSCLALEASEPLGFLQDNVLYHNCSDVCHVDDGPVHYLVLKFDPRIEQSVETRASMRVSMEPTVYVAIANHVHGMTGAAPRSMANFCCGQAEVGSELAQGARVQALAMHLVSVLPQQSLFNLLGQGYRVVIAGHQFGGVLANAFATKLLLQLRQEIEMAEKMGINLSALSRTEDKVVSFAFSAPLFANQELQEVLQSHSLDNNLNTLWKPGDGSISFFHGLQNVFLAAPGEEDGSSGGGGQPPNFERILSLHSSSPEFRAAQAWATVLSDELGKTGRARLSHAFLTRLLDIQPLHKHGRRSSGLGHALVDADTRLSPSQHGHHSMSQAPALVPPAATRTSAGAQAPTRTSAAGSPSSPAATAATGAAALSPTVRARATVRVVETVRAVSVLGSPRGGDAGASSPVGRSVSTKTRSDGPGHASRPAAEGAKAAPHSPAGDAQASGMKGALRALLKHLDAASAASRGAYTGVGNLWLLQNVSDSAAGAGVASTGKARAGAGAGSAGAPKSSPAAPSKSGTAPASKSGTAPAPKSGLAPSGAKASASAPAPAPAKEAVTYKAEVTVQLVPVPLAEAAMKSREWCSDTNPNLLSRWEYSMEEVKKDLMEAFPWVCFKTTVLVEGCVRARQELMRVVHMDRS